jgi:hypothetical protein
VYIVVEHACQSVDLMRRQQWAQLITNVLQTEPHPLLTPVAKPNPLLRLSPAAAAASTAANAASNMAPY